MEAWAALDNFRWGVWAKHGWTMTLRYMAAHAKLSGRVAPRLDFPAEDQTSRLELSNMLSSAGRPLDLAVAPRE